jgi:hypothetical protein
MGTCLSGGLALLETQGPHLSLYLLREPGTPPCSESGTDGYADYGLLWECFLGALVSATNELLLTILVGAALDFAGSWKKGFGSKDSW